MFHGRKKVTHIWNNIRINDDNVNFQVNYTFKRRHDPFPSEKQVYNDQTIALMNSMKNMHRRAKSLTFLTELTYYVSITLTLIN